MIQFLRKYVVPVAKRVIADLLDFAARKKLEVVSGFKFFHHSCKFRRTKNSEKTVALW